MSVGFTCPRYTLVGMAIALGVTLFGCLTDRPPVSIAADSVVKADVEDVLPVEDLMREHGVLRRILLIYREGIRRANGGEAIPAKTILGAAKIVQRFIESYHEKLEENYLFPQFEQHKTLTDLVVTLRNQHEAGRRITDRVISLSQGTLDTPSEQNALVDNLQQFIRMYEPHAAREDTVLFPTFRSVISPQQYDRFGDIFEDEEHARFGPKGFENIVEQVATLEKSVGIYDLSQFTPH